MVWIDNHESFGLRQWYRQTSTEVVGCQGISCCLYSHPVYSFPLVTFSPLPVLLTVFRIKERLLFTPQTKVETQVILLSFPLTVRDYLLKSGATELGLSP